MDKKDSINELCLVYPDNLNEKLSEDILVRILSYLHGGMILRCTSVCKFWNFVCNNDYLWFVRMCLELEGIPKLNFAQNIELNKKVIREWRKQNGATAKQYYIATRRKEKHPENQRIFPRPKNIFHNW